MSKTAVYNHSCENEYQDTKYAKGKRVFNESKDGWVCTVCGGKLGESSGKKK